MRNCFRKRFIHRFYIRHTFSVVVVARRRLLAVEVPQLFIMRRDGATHAKATRQKRNSACSARRRSLPHKSWHLFSQRVVDRRRVEGRRKILYALFTRRYGTYEVLNCDYVYDKCSQMGGPLCVSIIYVSTSVACYFE